MDRLTRGLQLLAESKAAYRPRVARPFTAGQPIHTDWSTERAIKYGVKASTWVYRCVSMTMEAASTVPWGIQRKVVTKGENKSGRAAQWEFDWDHPTSQLLATWNNTFDHAENVQRLAGYLLVSGNALTAKFRGLGQVRRLFVEPPNEVRPEPDSIGGIDRYEYFTSEGKQDWWEAKDIIHARLPDLGNPYWGMGRLQALAKAIDSDVEMVRLNKRRLEVGGVPDGILVDPSIASETVRRKGQKELELAWRDVKGPFLQGDGIDWIQMGLNQRDLQWLEGRQFSMREIVIGFGYHPALFGEDATYANSASAQKMKWVDAVLPVLGILVRAFTRGLVPPEEWPTTRVWYDTSGVDALKENLDGSIKSYAVLVGSGQPPDTAKTLVGLPVPDLPDGLGKIPLVLGTLRTLERTVAEDPDPAAEDLADPEAPPAAGGDEGDPASEGA